MLFWFFLVVALIGLVAPQLAADILLKGSSSREALIFVRVVCIIFIVIDIAINVYFRMHPIDI